MIDFYIAYLRDVRRMSPHTVESYARDLGALADFADKRKTSVEALTRRDLEAFARHLMTQGLAPRSVARAVASCAASPTRPRQARAESATCGGRAPGPRSRSFSISMTSIDCWRSPM